MLFVVYYMPVFIKISGSRWPLRFICTVNLGRTRTMAKIKNLRIHGMLVEIDFSIIENYSTIYCCMYEVFYGKRCIFWYLHHA